MIPVERPAVLVFVSHYLPGHRAGGLARAVGNLVGTLADDFSFHVVTTDRDFGSRFPYQGVTRGSWCTFGNSRVIYLRPGAFLIDRIVGLMNERHYDLMYVNSIFARAFSMLPLWLRHLGLAPRIPVLCAPRGELSPAALTQRSARKRAYLSILAASGAVRDAHWQAASSVERGDISRVFGRSARILVAGDVVQRTSVSTPRRSLKRPGSLAVVSIARIHPHKNLEFALRALAKVRGTISFDIFGPVEDQSYWRRCLRVIAAMPQNVRTLYRGEIASHEVKETLARSDLLFQPSLSESFGHSIVEALQAGCPVIIGDQTPWQGLTDAKAGFGLPLTVPGPFVAAVQSLTDMDAVSFTPWRVGAQQYAREHAGREKTIAETARILLDASGRAGRSTSSADSERGNPG